jgi:hypothetical protein
VDHGGPLLAWMDAVIRRRRGEGGPPGWRDDPWRLKREQRPATMAGQLRVMAAEQPSGGSELQGLHVAVRQPLSHRLDRLAPAVERQAPQMTLAPPPLIPQRK